MNETMLVITAGVSDEERRELAERMGPSPYRLAIEPLRACDMDIEVSETCRALLAGRGSEGELVSAAWPLAFLAQFPRSRIDELIKVFKSVVERRAVFASLTPTNGEWTWRYLLEHLDEEHRAVLEMERKACPDRPS